MAKRKKTEKPKREVTRRQLSHWQKQKKRERIIIALGIFVIVTVIVVTGVGLYFSANYLSDTITNLNTLILF